MRLTDKVKYEFEWIKAYISTQKFTMLFLLSLILSIYGVFAIAYSDNYVNGFLNILTNPIYITIHIFLLYINTIFLIDQNHEDYYYHLRVKNKVNYYDKMRLGIVINNVMLTVFNLVILMILLNLFNRNGTSTFVLYNIPSWLYLIYIVVKIFFISNIFLIFNFYFLTILKKNIVIFISVAINIIFMSGVFKVTDSIDSILEMSWFFGNYLIFIKYQSFLFEILVFILFVVSNSIILYIVKKWALKINYDL
jgi:hypothetical protein